MSNIGDYLLVREVAGMCRVKADTVRLWIARGDLPGAVRCRRGKSFAWLIPRAAVLARLEVPAPGERVAMPPAALTVEEKRARWPALAAAGLV